jgi:hypothetical protein
MSKHGADDTMALGDLIWPPAEGYDTDALSITVPTSTTIATLTPDLTFYMPGDENEEALRFTEAGEVYVRGELVDSNPEIWEAVKAWMVGWGWMT